MSEAALKSWAKLSWAVSKRAATKLARDTETAYYQAGGDELERLWSEAHKREVA